MAKDIFGRYLEDFFDGKETYEITEREDGFVSVTPIKRYFQGYSDWRFVEKEAMRYVRGKVLDIGCGAGRHSLFLQRNTHEVTGLDNSSKALWVSKKRGVKNTIKLDINELNKLKNQYDTALLLGNNFGLMGSKKNSIDILNKLYKKIKYNGVLLVGLRNPYKIEGEKHRDYFKKNNQKNRLPGQIKIKLRYKELESDWIDFLLLSPKELCEVVKETNWELKEIIGERKKDYVGLITK